ncbi:uncharacterized protein LOC135697552 [Ochlerotatus camptorhynchus]|uniref:uncharacterized protein LOC135697552 n=1 Tax=Ochlerotatus camptorhynchus TaxID=644619 RepID=UPI0031D6C10D
MDVNSFRRIGFAYAVVWLLASTVGAVYFFKNLVKNESICVDYFCENGTTNLLSMAINMMICAMSITFAIFVKIGIDETIPGYIHICRVFMLTRSLILTVRWTYESVALRISQINGDTRPNVARAENIATILLMTMAAICGLEVWILNGVQRYVKHRAQENSRNEEMY